MGNNLIHEINVKGAKIKISSGYIEGRGFQTLLFIPGQPLNLKTFDNYGDMMLYHLELYTEIKKLSEE